MVLVDMKIELYVVLFLADLRAEVEHLSEPVADCIFGFLCRIEGMGECGAENGVVDVYLGIAIHVLLPLYRIDVAIQLMFVLCIELC